MSKLPSKNKNYQSLLQKIGTTYQTYQVKAFSSVNKQKVLSYWAIGRHIIEYEQAGKVKAEYGKQLLVQLAKDLKPRLGKGFSRSNLYMMRLFYVKYSKIQTVSGKLNTAS